jgi:hypothetical protein
MWLISAQDKESKAWSKVAWLGHRDLRTKHNGSGGVQVAAMQQCSLVLV